MEHDEIERFGRRGNEQVWQLSPALAPRGQEALDLEGPGDVLRGGLHEIECVERGNQAVPFVSVARGVTDFDFEIADRWSLVARDAPPERAAQRRLEYSGAPVA